MQLIYQVTFGFDIMTKKIDQAVIMVGGMGTRLRPLTETCPKPILPVLDKPCLMYLIENIASAGISEIILACGYRYPQLAETIGDGLDIGIDISYSFEDEPLGTAGAIKKVEGRLGDTFVAANGDVFSQINVAEEIEEHISSKASITISLTEVNNPCEYGIARIDKDGRISEFKEKPKPEEVFSNLINAGIYVMEKDVLSLVPDKGQYDLSKELVPELMERGDRIQGYMYKGSWLDVGRPSDLIGANQIAASMRFDNEVWPRHKTSGTSINKPFYLGRDSSITNSISDSSVVLEGCRVSESKLNGSLIMKNCIVESSILTNSILGSGCNVCFGSTIEDSVLGDGTNVPAGTRIINNEVNK